ncbi:MAG: hypothetical protein CL926_00360 [Deltaproteobacteria bacterium]|nr:hypothetical protein [Deltaproteobacteria bacterium]|tara:strand:+ start:8786 stop:9370 length:585 start_codon:yes stop_codon:yes gene_type:complete
MDIYPILGDDMDLADSGSHQFADYYPCRLPVWWARVGEVGPHCSAEGVSGMNIVLRIEKRFTRFERILAKVLRAPREVRRPLDGMNSMLWELCDGSRSFQTICGHMDEVFKENIAPAVDRTASGIESLKSRNLMTVLQEPFAGKWNIGPGQTPQNQTLNTGEQAIKFDVEPRSEAERNVIQVSQEDLQLGDQYE